MHNTRNFAVGDRVVGVAEESGIDIRGMTGTVTFCRLGKKRPDYAVEFDELDHCFHSCGGHTVSGRGLWCWPENIALIEEESWGLDVEPITMLL